MLERGPVGRRSVHREDELDGPGEQRREPGHDLLAGDAGPQRLVQRKAGATLYSPPPDTAQDLIDTSAPALR